MLRVRILGELQLELDGQPLRLPARRPARALLGWLAVHPGMHARGAVAAQLWPNVLDESARVSLRSALAALRSAIGPASDWAVPATRAVVGLAGLPGVWVDAREFDRLLSDKFAQEALDLCRGELLTGFDEDWVLATRDEHRARQAEALGTLARAAVATGDHEAAVALARRRARLDPFDETAHRELISLLGDGGDRGGALIAYQRLAERLRRELGVAPSPTTRALAAKLRETSRSVETQPSAPASDRREHGPQRPLKLSARIESIAQSGPLFGRELQLARLHEVWTRSQPGSRRLALVTGEPGIGKTRLVSELAAELHAHGVTVLYGAAREDALVPYEPFVESLREPLRQPVELPSEAAPLASLLPELAALLRVPSDRTPLGAPAPGARLRLFDAFGVAVDAIASARPLVLILEDLHWAEVSTVRLLIHLASRPGGAPQALVVTYRDTELGGRHPLADGLADLYRALPVEQIGLQGIGTDAVAAMVTHARSGGEELDAARLLRDRTGGNPFFIEQLLRGATQPSQEHEAGPLAVGVEHVVARRVAALGQGARPILEIAAIAGAEFELPLLAEISELRVAELLDLLDAAVKAGLVAEVLGEPGRYEFVHAIVRETLVGALTAARRAHIHDLIARSLTERAERDPDRYLPAAANHALEAAAGHGDPERAADLAERAASRAGAVLAHEDAIGLLRRALLVLEQHGGRADLRAELRCSLAEALARAGSSDARVAVREARELSVAAGRADLLARCALAQGGTGVTILGADPKLVIELERALDAVGSAHHALRARLLSRLAIERAYEHDPTRRESASAEALQIAGRLDDPVTLAAALNARHVALWGPDHTEQRKEVADEMLDLTNRAGDRALALQARNWRIVDLLELGDGQAVRDELDAYAALAAELHLPAYSWYVPMWRATIALLEGRSGEGIELSRRARDLGRKAGDRNADVFFAEQQLLRHLAEGRLADIDPGAGGVDGPVAERAERGPAWRAYRFTFAWLHAERGEIERAREDFHAALADGFASLPRDVNWLDALNAAAHVTVLIGDLEHARELRILLDPYADRMIVNARGALHAGSVAYVLARLAAACGDDAAADRLYEHATQRDHDAGAPVWLLRDINHHSSLLHAIGAHGRAKELAGRAAELDGVIRRASHREPWRQPSC